MRRRRCLIPADGFYEWREAGGRKRAFFVRRRDGAPFAFAGLNETWTGPNGEELDTAAIVTTTANRTLSVIHDRMPVILPDQAFDLWLDCAKVDAETAAALLVPARDDALEAYQVSPAVNRVANDSPELIAPYLEQTNEREAAAAPSTPPDAKPKPAKKSPDQLSLL
jgi:putative SOS response-associated peptidase YedK